MIKFLFTILPVVIMATLALFSGILIEYPEYAASPQHRILIFLLGLMSWFCISTAFIRKAYGFNALGYALAFLGLTSFMYPDLWLRWPEATLAGLALSQAGAMLAHRYAFKHEITFAIMLFATTVLALLPTVMVIYKPWPPVMAPYIGALAILFICLAIVWAWFGRQRQVSAVSVSALVLALFVIGVLALTSGRLLVLNLADRQKMEEYLTFALLAIVALYISEQLSNDRSLRTGAHMSLDPSLRDALTNLANRRALDTFGNRLLARSLNNGRATSIILCDIDHFKLINDTHGHQTGDTVLKHTARILQDKVRKSDLVVRYGGEEFLIMLPGSPLAPSLRLAEVMRGGIESQPILSGDLSLKVTMSFGVATAFPEEPVTLTELIARADANMYRAKREGRNCVKTDSILPPDF